MDATAWCGMGGGAHFQDRTPVTPLARSRSTGRLEASVAPGSPRSSLPPRGILRVALPDFRRRGRFAAESPTRASIPNGGHTARLGTSATLLTWRSWDTCRYASRAASVITAEHAWTAYALRATRRAGPRRRQTPVRAVRATRSTSLHGRRDACSSVAPAPPTPASRCAVSRRSAGSSRTTR